jgi:hypothetical protein
MNRCVCLIRQELHYRRQAFEAGLRAAGYAIVHSISPVKPGDLLVIWNRYGAIDQLATQFERASAAVIVCENGYLGTTYDEHSKPYAPNGEPLLAMALWHHNGAGQWHVGEPGRWREQGIQVHPWRRDGDHVLVLPQRGIGPPGVAMPLGWPATARQKLKTMTERPIKIRSHPESRDVQQRPTAPLAADLGNAWCAVTWGSSAALKALCAGVPVFSTGFSDWIGAPACWPLAYSMEQPRTDDDARKQMLDRLAWAQFTLSEIATGEPFRRLMDVYRERPKAA